MARAHSEGFAVHLLISMNINGLSGYNRLTDGNNTNVRETLKKYTERFPQNFPQLGNPRFVRIYHDFTAIRPALKLRFVLFTRKLPRIPRMLSKPHRYHGFNCSNRLAITAAGSRISWLVAFVD
jgi:hypothetical protein